MVFTPLQSNSTNAQGTILLATDMTMNNTTVTNPSGSSSLLNCQNVRYLFTGLKGIMRYEFPVSRTLDYSSTATGADVPTLPDPSMGCPGMLLVYASGLANSITYFNVHIIAAYALKGRR